MDGAGMPRWSQHAKNFNLHCTPEMFHTLNVEAPGAPSDM